MRVGHLALLVVAAAMSATAAVGLEQLQFPKKLEAEWADWKVAFDSAAGGEPARLQRSSIPALFKAHFELIHASLPGHEAHDHITQADEELFSDEARSFAAYAAAQLGEGEAMSWEEFKTTMGQFMDAKSDQSAALRRASAGAV